MATDAHPTSWTTLNLPIAEALPAVRDALRAGPNVVLEAPPGAGKTTVVPLALLDQPWRGDGKILMLEPRRIAARAAARRMASLLGEKVGDTVGYRMRLDRKISKDTRIEVVTEGMLLRDLQRDPSLDGVAAIIFDEFHERSLDADMSLALVQEVQGALRDDLRLIVMSATLDGDAVARLIDAPVVRTQGRMFPVENRYVGTTALPDLCAVTARTVIDALGDETGSILVFLPGVGEIRTVARLLEARGLSADTSLHPLFGDLSAADQDAAIAPAPPGRRKVVLATAIAETSLTIDGVRIVIDCGRMRRPAFDPASGMTRLQTIKVSAAAAEQRRGRAGRTEPGVCYRLWSEAETVGLTPHTAPEIENADLAPLALELAVWGASGPDDLNWMTPPPHGAYDQARTLLHELGALDGDGRITPHGRALSSMPVHPRLAHMILKGRDMGAETEAALIAALLSERDILRTGGTRPEADLTARLRLVRSGKIPGKSPVLAAARQILRRRDANFRDLDIDQAGRLLALAYPDRVAERRPGKSPRYLMASGRGAALDDADALGDQPFLAVATLGGPKREARIHLAAPLSRDDIEDLFSDLMVTTDEVQWNTRTGTVEARRVTRFEALELNATKLANPPAELVTAAVMDGIRDRGINALPWTAELEALRCRVAFCRRHDANPYNWPDLSDAALEQTLEDWLSPFIGGVSRASDFSRIDLSSAIRALIPWDMQQALDRQAPTHLEVPSESRIRVDYGAGDPPVLAARLQEMFGLTETPRIMDGRVPVLIHLLSPAGRPLQVTQDLAGFWTRSYAQVKAEMKGRYPKHHWPDDPLTAAPTARVRHPRKKG
jgi:ATP-dependent helicase HrpB